MAVEGDRGIEGHVTRAAPMCDRRARLPSGMNGQSLAFSISVNVFPSPSACRSDGALADVSVAQGAMYNSREDLEIIAVHDGVRDRSGASELV